MSDQSSSTAIVVATPKQPTRILLVQQNAILEMKRLFKRDVHFGPPYPGSKKDTLLKPGAELLARRFGIYPHYEAVKEILTINPSNLDDAVIVYIYRCQMIDIATSVVVGEAIGACSSLEDKYHYRSEKTKCPSCGAEALIKSKKDSSKWWCNTYKEGCGKEFALNDPAIINQVVGKIVNPNPLNELNTVIKMAQKRAMVSAVIVATGASAYFTPGDAEVTDAYAAPVDDDDTNTIDTEWEDITDVPDSFPEDQPAGQQPPAKSQPQQKSNVIPDNPKAWLNDVQYLIDKALKAFEGITTADIQKYVGFTDLKDITEKGWGKYPDAKTAGTTIKDGFEADLKKIAEDAPAQPKAAAAPAAPSTTPVSPFGKNAQSTKAHEWTPEDIADLEEYAASHWFDVKFGKGMDTMPVLESLKINAWSEVADPKAAKSAITAYMVSNHIAIIANKVKYVKAGKGGYAALSNGEVMVRLYGRDQIRNLGEQWGEYVEAWEANEEYIFAEDEMANLVVEWEPKFNEKGEHMYNNAVLVSLPLDSVPSATW